MVALMPGQSPPEVKIPILITTFFRKQVERYQVQVNLSFCLANWSTC
jgi:hypothetical protein